MPSIAACAQVVLDFEFVSTNSSIRAGMTQAICGLRQSLDAVLPGAMIISSTFAGAYPSFEWDWPAITKCLDLIMPMNYGLCSASDLNQDKTPYHPDFPCKPLEDPSFLVVPVRQ